MLLRVAYILIHTLITYRMKRSNTLVGQCITNIIVLKDVIRMNCYDESIKWGASWLIARCLPTICPCIQSRSNKPICARAASEQFSVINEPTMKMSPALYTLYTYVYVINKFL